METINKIHKLFYEELKNEENLNFLRGVWSLYYIEGAKKFKTLGFHSGIDLKEENQQIKDFLNTIDIKEGFGSNGWAYNIFLEGKEICFLNDTYNDPRGTVIELDYKIGQKNTAFIDIRNNDKVVGIIMIYGEQEFAKDHENTILMIYTKYKLHFQLLVEKQRLLNVQSVFKHSSVDKDSNDIDLKSRLKEILVRTLYINNQLNIPYFYILEKNSQKPKYIAFSEQILSLIEYELKFCSYLDSREKGCYFKNPEDCTCSMNQFLKRFFFNAVCKLKKTNISLISHYIDFNLQIFSHDDLGSNDWSLNEFVCPVEFENNPIALKKYINEVVIKQVKQLHNSENLKYVCSVLTREEKTVPLIDNPSCYRSNNNISNPSVFLPYYYEKEYPDIGILKRYPLNGDSNENPFKYSPDKGPASHVIAILWNNEPFFQLLNDSIIKNSHDIKDDIKILQQTFGHSEEKKIAYSEDGYTICGINDSDLQNNAIAASYIELTRKDYLRLRQFEKTMLNAERAAISQVMARNMSHNIGSHVLSKITTIQQLKSIYKNDINTWQCKISPDHEIHDDEDIKSVIKQTSITEFERISYHNYTYLARFFSYLKDRMDFLADVTTNTPVIENIKFIYKDIIKPYVQNRVLNDRISGLDTFDYDIIACFPDSGINAESCERIVAKSNCFCKLDQQNDMDRQVGIPNDVLGVQAFYTIIENIIRNTAKHGQSQPKTGRFEFKVKIEEAKSKFVSCPASEVVDLGEYYSISIFDNCIIKDIQSLVQQQNEKIKKSILEKTELRHGGWGLIEMAASAAYLRKIPVAMINSDEYKISDLSGENPYTEGQQLCIYQAYAEQGKYLGYRFFVYKPREILIIADDSYEQKIKSKLKNEGVWIVTKKEIIEAIKNDYVFPHKLVVISEEVQDVEIDQIPNFSKRWFKKTAIILDTDDIQTLKLNLWKEYYEVQCIPFYINRLSKEEIEIFQKIAFTAAVDDHGVDYCRLLKSNKFVEVINSSTTHYYIPPNPTEPNLQVYMQSAAEPVPIIVLDERIQEFAYKTKYSIKNSLNCKVSDCFHQKGGVPYNILYQNTNITVPAPGTCNLNEQSFYSPQKSEYKKIIDIVQSFIKTHKNDKLFFIVIHLGIIEKLIRAHNQIECEKYDKDDGTSMQKFITTVLLPEGGSYLDNIIITSGRGTPHNIPDNIRYLNYSVISQYMITLRNKFAFTEVLYCARKTNKK